MIIHLPYLTNNQLHYITITNNQLHYITITSNQLHYITITSNQLHYITITNNQLHYITITINNTVLLSLFHRLKHVAIVVGWRFPRETGAGLNVIGHRPDRERLVGTFILTA